MQSFLFSHNKWPHILKVSFEWKFLCILKIYTNYKLPTASVLDKCLKIKILEIAKKPLSNFYPHQSGLFWILNRLIPSYETLDECGTTQDLSKNTKIVIKVRLLFWWLHHISRQSVKLSIVMNKSNSSYIMYFPSRNCVIRKVNSFSKPSGRHTKK